MAEGRSNAAIAQSLVVSDGAVEKHVRNIFTKLDLAPTSPITAACSRCSAGWVRDECADAVADGSLRVDRGRRGVRRRRHSFWGTCKP